MTDNLLEHINFPKPGEASRTIKATLRRGADNDTVGEDPSSSGTDIAIALGVRFFVPVEIPANGFAQIRVELFDAAARKSGGGPLLAGSVYEIRSEELLGQGAFEFVVMRDLFVLAGPGGIIRFENELGQHTPQGGGSVTTASKLEIELVEEALVVPPYLQPSEASAMNTFCLTQGDLDPHTIMLGLSPATLQQGMTKIVFRSEPEAGGGPWGSDAKWTVVLKHIHGDGSFPVEQPFIEAPYTAASAAVPASTFSALKSGDQVILAAGVSDGRNELLVDDLHYRIDEIQDIRARVDAVLFMVETLTTAGGSLVFVFGWGPAKSKFKLDCSFGDATVAQAKVDLETNSLVNTSHLLRASDRDKFLNAAPTEAVGFGIRLGPEFLVRNGEKLHYVRLEVTRPDNSVTFSHWRKVMLPD